MKNDIDKTMFKRIKKDLVAKYGTENAEKMENPSVGVWHERMASGPRSRR